VTRLLLLRGAPGAGKSTTARALAAFRPAPAVVEVDELRGDLWQVPAATRLEDAERHHIALVHAARLARALLDAGALRVVVVDTFAPGGVLAFTEALRGAVDVRSVTLAVAPLEHKRRLLERTGVHAFRDFGVASRMNVDLESETGEIVRSAGAPEDVAGEVARRVGWALSSPA
jgi:chloramphenicol 3-O-phosphotransferase